MKQHKNLALILIPVIIAFFLSVGLSSAQTTNETIISNSNLDLTLYIMIISVLSALAIIAFKYWSILGAFGGLLGAIFSYVCLTSQYLIIQSVWDETQQAWVTQLYPIGFFAYLPLVLTALNFFMVLKKQ